MSNLILVPSLLLSYQIHPRAPPPQRAHPQLRAPALSMEYRLNNYVLPGPLQPLNNQVLVKLRKVADTTTGGLFVPTADTEKPKEGVVVSAGPGAVHPTTGKLLPCPVKEGDLVLLTDFTGESVDYNGEKHLFVGADSLLGSFDAGALTIAAFKPLADNVMVAVTEAATETTTGIALAGMEEDDSNQGEVVAVGPGKLTANGEVTPMPVAAGESVMYARYTGAEATVEGKKFKIVPSSSCLAKW